MSLMASAHMRMQKKRTGGGVTSPRGGDGDAVISPRGNNNEEDVISPRNYEHGGRGGNVPPPSPSHNSSSSPVIATFNGNKSQYHVSPGMDSQSMMMQQQDHQLSSGPPMQMQQQQQQHRQRTSVQTRRGYHTGGINSLDTSGDYVVEGHHTPAWSSTQHGGNTRGQPSPSPSSYRSASPTPYQQQHHHQQQPPSPIRQQNATGDQSFETAIRHQGNYSHYLSPRQVGRVANRPRRRYDSFTKPPSGEEEDEVLQHHQTQYQSDRQVFQQQWDQMQQSHTSTAGRGQSPQAFDPFASSPLTIPGAPQNNMNARAASPLFPNGAGSFPQQQLMTGGRPSGMYGPTGASPPRGTMMYDGSSSKQHRSSPPRGAGPMLNTIEGNTNFVYDTEDGVGESPNPTQENEESEDYGEEDETDSRPSPGSHGGNPRPLMNHYDFEYHTEKDEASTFSYGATSYEHPPQQQQQAHPAASQEDDSALVTENQYENQTVSSEHVLVGTPVKKKQENAALSSKKKKRHHGHKNRIVIDNVEEADKEASPLNLSRGNQQEDDSLAVAGDDIVQEKESSHRRITSHEIRDIAKHAERMIAGLPPVSSSGVRDSMSESVDAADNEEEDEDDVEEYDDEVDELMPHRLPPRLPMSKNNTGSNASVGTSVATSGSNKSSRSKQKKKNAPFISRNGSNDGIPRIGMSKSWDSQVDVMKQATGSESFGSFSRNLVWDNDINNPAAQQEHQPPRASKSWDEDNLDNLDIQNPIASWGTWGDNTAALFNGGENNVADSDKENLFSQQDDGDQDADEKALAEWDKAEAKWRGNVSAGDDALSPPLSEGNNGPPPLLSPKKPPSLLSPPREEQDEANNKKKYSHHPWKTSNDEPLQFDDLNFEPAEPSVFSDITKPSVFAPGASGDDDDDSLFEFERKKGEVPQQPQAHPAKSIFGQINNSLKQADKTKRALNTSQDNNIETEGSADPTIDTLSDEAQRAKEEALLKKVQESPGTVESGGSMVSGEGGSKAGLTKRITFTDSPKVHTYVKPTSSSASGSDLGDSEYDYNAEDDNDDDSDDDNVEEPVKAKTDKGSKATSNIPLSEKIAVGSQRKHQRQKSELSTDQEDNDSQHSDNDTFGDSTLGEDTIGEDTYKTDDGTAIEDTPRKQEQDDDLGFMGHVETGFNVLADSLGGLFGLGSPGADSVAATEGSSDRYEKGKSRSATSKDRSNNTGGSAIEEAPTTDEKSIETDGDRGDDHTIQTDFDNETYGESTVTGATTNYTDTVRTEDEQNDWLGYMSNMLFPKERNVHGDESIVTGSETTTKYTTETYDESSGYNQEDEDSYLLLQALAAARAIHHVQGVEYDETLEINVLTDIKFVVVTVSLPLGLLFQEHEVGVWVSRVVPEGNGGMKGVMHGDQLAAINGNSSVHATIDEVAHTISSTPEGMGVELTFLRYVGPLRPVPGSVIQEGFEVTDTSLSRSRNKGSKSKRGLFSKRRSSKHGMTPPSSPGLSTRRFGLDLSPGGKSPKRSPKSANSSPYTSSSPGRASAAASIASSKASSRKSVAKITVPSLSNNAGQQQQQTSAPPKQTKKKKSLGKILSFKKKG